MAASYNKLGVAHFNKGVHGKAIEYFDRALIVTVTTAGEAHPSACRIQCNIGEARISLGDDAAGRETIEKALLLWASLVGDGHRDLARPQSVLGLACAHTGDRAQALLHSDKALTIAASQGATHPSLILSHGNYGLALEALGDAGAAVQHLRKAVDIGKAALGGAHPDVVKWTAHLERLYSGESRTEV